MRKESGYWTYERCKEEVSKYNTKKELYNNNRSLYITIHKRKWCDLIDKLKSSTNSILKRLIYVYEFSDNYFYVGLTCNINDRDDYHLTKNKSQVYKHIIKSGINPILIIRTPKLSIEDAVEMEGIVLNEYIKNGWKTLNIAKTGSTGGFSNFNIDKCFENIKNCKTISEFREKFSREYCYIIRHKFNKSNKTIIKLFNAMRRNKSIEYNDKEVSRLESSLYKNRYEFSILSPTAYKCSRINGWLDEFFKVKIFNNKEECKLKSLECKNRSEFFKKYRTAYRYASLNDWLDEFYPKIKINFR